MILDVLLQINNIKTLKLSNNKIELFSYLN